MALGNLNDMLQEERKEHLLMAAAFKFHPPGLSNWSEELPEKVPRFFCFAMGTCECMYACFPLHEFLYSLNYKRPETF